MCKVHNKLYGKEALFALESINRNITKACDARINYLEKQVKSFREWLACQECEDVDKAIENLIFWEFDAETHVSDVQLDCSGVEVDRLQEEYELAREYETNLEKTVSKSMRVRMDDLGFYRWKIECLETQLKLHDKIQDALDALDPTDRPMVKKYFQRLDALLHSRELSFDGWVIFQNQLAKMIGREDLVKELDPTFKVLPERIRYYECKMEAKRMEIEFKATEFQERSLDQLDNDLIPVEALVSVTE